MKSITACLRGTGAFPKRVYYTCNPGGQGHGYIKRIFIDRRYEPGEKPEDYTFIPSLVTDNTALMRAQPDYIEQLRRFRRSSATHGCTVNGTFTKVSFSRNSPICPNITPTAQVRM